MALGFYFTPSGFTPEKYDEVLRASKPQAPGRRPAGSTTRRSRAAA